MVGDIFQPTHLLFILLVALLVLGPKRLPEVGRTLGSGIRDFRQALSGESHESSHEEPDSEQVTSGATDLHHDPDVGVAENFDWSDDAVEAPSFDEPAAETLAEPTDAATVESEPTAHDAHADTADHPHTAAADDSHAQAADDTHAEAAADHTDAEAADSTAAPGVGATAEQEKPFSEPEPARQTAESGGSSESQPHSSD